MIEPRLVERVETADRRVERFALAPTQGESPARTDAIELCGRGWPGGREGLRIKDPALSGLQRTH